MSFIVSQAIVAGVDIVGTSLYLSERKAVRLLDKTLETSKVLQILRHITRNPDDSDITSLLASK